MKSMAYFNEVYWTTVEDQPDEETAHELALYALEPDPEQELVFDPDESWD